MAGRNVFGDDLELCGVDPVTGFYRDGQCTSGPRDFGGHTVCAVVTKEFLEHQRQHGNDLITPRPEMAFPGLRPGDAWCVVAIRWREAYEAGCAPPVRLRATSALALRVIPAEWLMEHAVDAPNDLSSLLGPADSPDGPSPTV